MSFDDEVHRPLAGRLWAILPILFVGLSPVSGRAQQWEVEGGWSMIDWDPPSYIRFPVEHLPAGPRFLGRFRRPGSSYFLEGGAMFGRSASSGAESSMWSWTVSGGRAFRRSPGRFVVGLRPSLGFGKVVWDYDGPDFPDNDDRWVYSFGADLEIGVGMPFGLAGTISLTAGLGWVGPFVPGTCEDCTGILTESGLSRRSLGILIYPGRT